MAATFEYEIQQHSADGWECVHTVDTRHEAHQSLHEYERNQPRESHRIRKVRVRAS